MPVSPQTNASDLIQVEISVSGTKIPDKLQIISVFIEKKLNKIPFAEIAIIDGAIFSQNEGWKAIQDGKFKVGNDIEIKAGYGTSSKNTIFKGYITAVRAKANRNYPPTILVEASDKALQMALNRAYTPFVNKKDSDIIQTLVRNYSGLSSEVDATKITHNFIAQYGSTDWDFLLARAEANGLVVNIEGAKISVKKPGSGAEQLTVSFGQDIIDMDLTMDGRNQKVKNTAFGWDHKNQRPTQQMSTEPSGLPSIGNAEVSASTMASKLKYKNDEIRSAIPVTVNELGEWATAILLKSRLNRLKGKISFQGSHKINPNDKLEIKEAGDQFNGKAFVSGVSHSLKSGNWTTTAILGLPDNFHLSEGNNISVSKGNNLLPGINGLLIGKVTKIHQDPDNEYRVEVNIPSIDDQNKVWARISNLWATSGSGTFFYPEINDEVILGFLDGDPRFPVILGKLYSSKLKPPYNPDQANPIQAFVSKNQLKLEYNNKDKIITLLTPGGIVFTMSDKENEVKITDSHKNTMTMNSKGFNFDTKKDFVVSAIGNIKIDAKGKIDTSSVGNSTIKAIQNLTMSGMQFELKATTTGTVQANASMTVSATGITTIKGSMIKLN